MRVLNNFLIHNPTAKQLTTTYAKQQKGGRRFLTTSWETYQSKLNELSKTHCMGAINTGKHDGRYCIEW